MNTDFRISTDFLAHPKTRAVQRLCGPEGVICIIGLWSWCALRRPTGDLTGLDDLAIADAAGWPMEKDPTPFIEALRGRFLDGDSGAYSLHDWHEHNPWAADAPTRSQDAKKAAHVRHHATRKQPLRCRFCVEDTERGVCLHASSAHADHSRDDAEGNASACDPDAEGNAPSPSPSPSPFPSPREEKDMSDPAPRGSDPLPSGETIGEVAEAYRSYARAKELPGLTEGRLAKLQAKLRSVSKELVVAVEGFRWSECFARAESVPFKEQISSHDFEWFLRREQNGTRFNAQKVWNRQFEWIREKSRGSTKVVEREERKSQNRSTRNAGEPRREGRYDKRARERAEALGYPWGGA